MPDEGAREARELLAAEYRAKEMFDEADFLLNGHVASADEEAALRAIEKALSRPPVSDRDGEVERVAKVIAPHLRTIFSVNPDCDDQERGRDYAHSVARAVIADLPNGREVPIELSGVREVLEECAHDGVGSWVTCSGCYEGVDGQNVNGFPHSEVLGCVLGGGCSECGGIGATWDTTDWSDFADFSLKQDALASLPHPEREERLKEALEKIDFTIRATIGVLHTARRNLVHFAQEQNEGVITIDRVLPRLDAALASLKDHAK